MVVVGLVALWCVILGISIIVYRQMVSRNRAYERLSQAAPGFSGEDSGSAAVASRTGAFVGTGSAVAGEGYVPPQARGTRRLSRRWRWVPWAFGLAVMLTISLLLQWPLQYVLAIGAVVSLLARQLEGFLATKHVAKLENQLADALDIMVGALAAGAAVGPAIEAATLEIDAPLKPYLEEISGRIRLGDEPIEVFRSLADRVPLETFLLFSSALAVHWEVGGRLAPTLASVGRTIRDRIDVNRRIQSNIAQSQFSTFAILGLIYLIALIVWRNGPEQMEEFVRTTVGSWFVAGSIVLQAVGIIWMDLMSKPKF